MSLTKNPITHQPHTAKWTTIIGGAIAIVCIAGVAFGNLPEETLVTIVAPLIGFLTMLKRNGG